MKEVVLIDNCNRCKDILTDIKLYENDKLLLRKHKNKLYNHKYNFHNKKTEVCKTKVETSASIIRNNAKYRKRTEREKLIILKHDSMILKPKIICKKNICNVKFFDKQKKIHRKCKKHTFLFQHCCNHQRKTVEFAKINGNYDSTNNSALIKKSSSIPCAGDGIFTNNIMNYYEGDFITKYEGKSITKLTETTNTEYTAYVKGHIVEGLKFPEEGKGLGSFINRPNNKSPNVCLHYDTHSNSIYIKAKTFIGKDNVELFLAYGKSYRININK